MQRHVWCHGHSHHATRGVVGAVVAPHFVLQVLSSCHVLCCGCCRRTAFCVTGAVVAPHFVSRRCHRAARGVTGTVAAPRVVSPALSSCRAWYRRRCRRAAVVGLRGVVVALAIPRAVSRSLLLHRVVLLSRARTLHCDVAVVAAPAAVLVITLSRPCRRVVAAKEEVSRKKKKEKRKCTRGRGQAGARSTATWCMQTRGAR